MTAKIKNHPHHTKTQRHRPKGVSAKSFERVYWPYIPVVILVVMLMALGAQNGLLTSVIKHPAGKVLAYATSISQEELLKSTNTSRQENGFKALSANAALTKAAQAKANDMVLRNYWSHNTPAGNPPWVFVDAQGYHYQKLGENLATGFIDSAATVKGWMASPEHRENMLDPAYSEVGFGFANDPNYTAVGGGPMTIVVAFYGQPSADVAAYPQSNSSNPLLGAGTAGNLPTQGSRTTRAQLAFAHLPVANYATLIVGCGALLAAGAWIGRHALTFRRAMVTGESFIVSHPMLDVGLIVLGLAFLALYQTAGFIQ